jgi:hypothetical protein
VLEALVGHGGKLAPTDSGRGSFPRR